MLSDQLLLPMRRVVSAALSVALLGVVGPSMARADDDDDSKDKKEVRVYEEDNDKSPQWNDREDEDDNDRANENNNDNDNDNDAPKVFRYKVERADSKGGYLGVRVQDITNSLRKARDLSTDEGALVNRVENDSPADEAGIMRGDVIIQVDEQEIDDSSDLIKAMQDIKPGSKTEVVVLRNGTRKTVRVEVAKRPRDMMMTSPGFKWEGMNREQEREMRKQIRENFTPEKMREMRMNMPGPEFREQMEDLRREMDDLKRELRDLREELDESRAQSRGRRSGS